jgi:hypothetical protein
LHITTATIRPEYRTLAPSSIYNNNARLQFSTTVNQYFAKETTSMSQEFKLKTEKPVTELKNGDKIEVEVEGIEGGKVLLAKVNDEYRALGPRCTRKYSIQSS